MTQLNQLSQRERDVAELLLQGKSNKQVAAVLNISVRAVEFHLSNIYAKLGVASRTEAVLKLTNTPIRESTDDNLRESVIDGLDTISDNGRKSITWRSPMKKLLLAICGTLLTTVLIIALILIISNTREREVLLSPSSNNSTQADSAPLGGTSLQFEDHILKDTAGDADPPFIDIVSTRISQIEVGFIEIEFTVNGKIPLSPDSSYGNVVYKIWIDSDYGTNHPAHGGGNAEFVLNIAYLNDINANRWAGSIFNCALGVTTDTYEVTIDGSTARAKIPLSFIGNPPSFRYSYESFTEMQGTDGDSNAKMDQITLNYNIPISQLERTSVPLHEPTLTNIPKPTSTFVSGMPLLTATPRDCTQGWTQLKIGAYAKVAGSESDPPNRVRAEPGKTNNVIAQIYPGAIVKVTEGPVCVDNLVFWKVENTSIPDGTGWTAEGDGTEYWLEPYAYTPEFVRLSAYNVSFAIPGSWSAIPNAENVLAGNNDWCKWPKHIKILLTTYPAQSEWKPIIYVYETERMPDWYPICPGAPLLRVRQQALSHGERTLFGSKNAQPIFNSELIYGYQGKTSDEKYTIFAFFPVNFPFLAYSFENLNLPQGGIPFNLEDQNWDAYYQAVGWQLEASTDLDFTPNLNILDTIVDSITVTTP